MANMYRIIMIYYVNPYTFFEALEKDWKKLLEGMEIPPLETTLFD